MIQLLNKVNESKKIKQVELNGQNLTLPQLLAISKYKANVKLSQQAFDNMQKSMNNLEQLIKTKARIYGITTGFGGSADTTTQKNILQQSLIGFLNAGFNTTFPDDVIRGMMTLRINTILRGYSACSENVVKYIAECLNHNLIPEVPERGSISASGDLIPLSYVGGLIIGKKGVFAKLDGQYRLEAKEALKRIGLEPIVLQPKDGLAIVNGTGASNSVAALALQESFVLFGLSEILTSLAAEAMTGDQESFDDFISVARPHPGQKEVAENLRQLLQHSKLCTHKQVGDYTYGLRQDRYHIRTAPQWLGPQLETLNSLLKTIEIEMNSTTDNPIFDHQNIKAYHGGNFQATSMAVIMEQLRMAVYHMGKLMFAQHSELVNKSMNKKLSPNLSFNNPSIDFHLKGVDITMAAYMSELGFLSNTAVNHVQSAELHNQTVYSLALVSGRYTRKAIELCQMMMAVHLYTTLQAIDLRIIQIQFMNQLKKLVEDSLQLIFEKSKLQEKIQLKKYNQFLKSVVLSCLGKQAVDTKDRFTAIFNNKFCLDFLNLIQSQDASIYIAWKDSILPQISELYKEVRNNYKADSSIANAYLGPTRYIYIFIRETLQVNMYKGEYKVDDLAVGQKIQKIFDAIQNEQILQPMLEAFTAKFNNSNSKKHQGNKPKL